MKKPLTSEERLERLRLLGERLELERMDSKTPAQLKRLADLDEYLESTRTGSGTARPEERRPSKGKGSPAAA